jgi:hypothetical protein
MNAIQPIETDAQAIGREQQELRGIIDDVFWACSIYMRTGHDYIEIGDDHGLEYTVRQLVIGAKEARNAFLRLKQSKLQALASAEDVR